MKNETLQLANKLKNDIDSCSNNLILLRDSESKVKEDKMVGIKMAAISTNDFKEVKELDIYTSLSSILIMGNNSNAILDDIPMLISAETYLSMLTVIINDETKRLNKLKEEFKKL